MSLLRVRPLGECGLVAAARPADECSLCAVLGLAPPLYCVVLCLFVFAALGVLRRLLMYSDPLSLLELDLFLCL